MIRFFTSLALCAVTLAAPIAVPVAAQSESRALRHVVIVSVDGLRPDLVTSGRAPAMQGQMRAGSFTLQARTVDEGYTVPSHVSMLTGVVPATHGVTWDRHIEDAYPNVPTLFEVARQAGRTTALAVGKTKLIVLTKPGTLDWFHLGNEELETDADIARAGAAIIREHQPDLLFVHLAGVDIAGHASGWGSPAQLLAVKRADDAVELIIAAVKDASLDSSTMIILTADHGGHGLAHPPEDPLSQFIPWIVTGVSVRKDFNLSQVPGLRITTMSTFATAALVLGLEAPQPLDAAPVMEIFTSAPR